MAQDASADSGSDLLKLLYAAPVGLAKIGPNGQFMLSNPEFSCLAQITLPEFDFGNFFALLGALAPELRRKVEAAAETARMILDDDLIPIPGAPEGIGALACTLSKAMDGGYNVVLRNATQTAERNRATAPAQYSFGAP